MEGLSNLMPVHTHPSDSALSATSTNPVQNKAVAKAIGDIEGVLTELLGV